jgi:hypothetical protein
VKAKIISIERWRESHANLLPTKAINELLAVAVMASLMIVLAYILGAFK